MKKPRRKKDGSLEIPSPCPLCGSKDNMETNSVSGVFHCWSCHFSGKKAASGAAPPSQRPEDSVPAPPPSGKEIRTEIPEWVRKKVLARNVSAEQLNRLGAYWNGRKVMFPVLGGPDWERSVFSWDEPKVKASSPKGILGLQLATPGCTLVLTEGDYKAAVIPGPWVGVGIGGKTLSEYQKSLLLSRQPGGLIVMLDGHEEQPMLDLIAELRTLGYQPTLARLPTGKGPDDVDRTTLIRTLLGAV